MGAEGGRKGGVGRGARKKRGQLLQLRRSYGLALCSSCRPNKLVGAVVGCSIPSAFSNNICRKYFFVDQKTSTDKTAFIPNRKNCDQNNSLVRCWDDIYIYIYIHIYILDIVYLLSIFKNGY